MFSLIQIFYINEEIKQIRELGFTTTTPESPERPAKKTRISSENIEDEKKEDAMLFEQAANENEDVD